MGRVKILAGFSLVAAALGAPTADAGFRTPESLIRNVYAYYGKGSPAFSNGLPHDEDAARQFFDSSLRAAWSAPHDAPYDFLVQSPTWRLGPISIAVLRRQFDRTDLTVSFDNEGRAVTLNFIVVNRPDGWVISDVESPHDSLRMFLTQFKR
ncbi:MULTISPECIES: hypothetical protein [Bradyrhizobium]|uniref:hypothetical protein n=1 Tax=Bradyrhizobium TaxID=374 RepID=UPI0004AF5BF4|nr:hypothetical protein [Bradyrhizobium elkanii]WLA86753.1 hypothetical protein QNJ99_22580 [Bradyrhizobium elkanii]